MGNKSGRGGHGRKRANPVSAVLMLLLLLAPAPLAAQDVDAAITLPPPSDPPPQWLTEVCGRRQGAPEECADATTTIFVGTVRMADEGETSQERQENSGGADTVRIDTILERRIRNMESAARTMANRNQAERVHVRLPRTGGIFKCSTMGKEQIKQSFLTIAVSFFAQTGYSLNYASAPDTIVAYGADSQTSRNNLVALLDLTLYRPGTIDGNVGCNILSTIYVTTQREGASALVNNGHAALLRQRLRQHFIGI